MTKPLPGLLAQIAEVAGEPAALAIAHAVGGTRIYMPPVPEPGHWLSELIGHEAALKVADAITCGLPGARVDVPTGPTGIAATTMASARAKMDRMIAEGRSERDIVLATRYTARRIRQRKAEIRDDRQMKLF